MKRLSVDRRSFLRGAGVSLGLPWLASASSLRGAEKIATPPVRSAFLYFPNGVWQKSWIPEAAGADFELPFSLSPLADLKSEVLIVSGLDKAHSEGGDGHYAKTANFLTGLHVEKTTGKEISSGGVSVDQLAAAKLGDQTPLPSLELAIDPVISGIDSNVGYTRLYGSYISWQTAERPVAREINPRFVYERFAGVRGPGMQRNSAARQLADDQSLLDLAFSDARDLRRQLGRDDRFKLDEYLDSVRAVERRIDYFSRTDPTLAAERAAAFNDFPAPPTERPKDFREHVRLMLDLMVLAFWTDSTRIVSFMFANDVSGRNFSFVDGVRGGHHEMSHHENSEEKIEQYQRINRWHVEQYAYLLDRLGSIREGEGTLLDSSQILLGCGMSDGNRHDPKNLPILVGGRAGGAIATGRHLAAPAGTPLCNLYVSMLDAAGAPVERFGDSAGALSGFGSA